MDASRFVDSNNLLFSPAWDHEDREWWRVHMFEPHQIYPDQLGARLSASAAGEKTITMGKIDRFQNAFDVAVRGQVGDTGRIWFHERRLNLSGNLFEARRMAIPASQDQGQGRGRLLMADLVDTAQSLGIARISVEAEDIGRYAWARFGFVPDRGSWNYKVRIEATRRLQMARPQLSDSFYQAFRAVLDSEEPEMIRVVASWTNVVESRHLDERGQPIAVTLGQALLLETPANWYGEFDLEDAATMTIFRRYVGRE